MGAIRLFLALVVVAGHVQSHYLVNFGGHFAQWVLLGTNAGIAVLFFYMISGFLISFVLSTKYAARTSGTRRFYESRFVRIFSVYWPTLLVASLLGSTDASFWDLVFRTVLVGSDWRLIFATYPTVHWGTYAPQLPQAWTLGAELTFYLFAPFLLRSLRASLAVLLVSLAVRAVLVATIGHVDAWTYHFLPATACFFLLGHFAQLAGRRFEVVRRGEFGAVMLAVAVVVSLRFYPQFDDPAFWVATLAFAAALPGVFHATKDSHWLNALGDLSYPVYLTHLFVIGFLFGPNRLQALAFVGDAITSFAARVAAPLDVRGGVTALCVGLICCLAAVVVHHAVERPVARLMHAVLRRSAWADAKFAAGQPEGLAPR